jgi:DNA-binding LacI/PurR family transcriptional regulator
MGSGGGSWKGNSLAVRETGLQVPDDISLVGFDDIELSTYCPFPP